MDKFRNIIIIKLENFKIKKDLESSNLNTVNLQRVLRFHFREFFFKLRELINRLSHKLKYNGKYSKLTLWHLYRANGLIKS